jgi:hypothetical protein
MDDKIFRVDLERSRIYWDYYKSMFLAFSMAMAAGMICTAVIYTEKEISLSVTVGVIALLFLCVILMAAVMSLLIWRHENRHFDDVIREEERELQERPPGIPLV